MLKLAALGTITALLLPALLRSTEHQAETPTPADPLLVLNKAFRAAYARSRAETLARLGPVVMVEGDTLVLVRAAKRTEAKVVPALYDKLKTVAHIPLALYAMLAPCKDGTLDEKALTELRGYRALLPPVRDFLSKQELTPAQKERQEKLIDTALAFVDRILKDGSVHREDLVGFTREMRPDIQENVADAARAQLDGMHSQMTAWRREMTPDEWKTLHVVIMGSHMPRKDHLATQYFSRLLGEPGESLRIVYAEALFDEKRALDLLGTSVLDSEIGTAFFEDKLRMHRDLLSDAAAAYLKTMTFEP